MKAGGGVSFVHKTVSYTEDGEKRSEDGDNLFFYPHLPEELYPSFLQHCNRLLLIGDYLACPQILIDCIYHKIPLIA